MIEATSKLLQQVVNQQATASHLSELSVECGGAPLVLQELEQLAETAGLKAMLWSMQQEMRDLGGAWMQGRLFELDVTEMQAKVCGCWAARAVSDGTESGRVNTPGTPAPSQVPGGLYYTATAGTTIDM